MAHRPPILTPALTVDIVILVGGKVVLIKRKNPPYQGKFALPGGFVDIGETVKEAALREAREETGVEIKIVELIGIYDDPLRDPRGHTVSIAYLATASGQPRAGSDALDVQLFSLSHLPPLAFDHAKIIEDAKEMLIAHSHLNMTEV